MRSGASVRGGQRRTAPVQCCMHMSATVTPSCATLRRRRASLGAALVSAGSSSCHMHACTCADARSQHGARHDPLTLQTLRLRTQLAVPNSTLQL